MTDFRIVAKFSLDGGGEYGITELFIDPADFTEPVTPDATATSGVPNISQLDLFTIRSVGIAGDDNVFFDDLIFADTFAEAVGQAAVVPEPASVAIWTLLGLGLAGFGFCRARRKK